MKYILLISTALVLTLTAIVVHLGENTLWVSDQTVRDYIDGKASLTVECGLPSK